MASLDIFNDDAFQLTQLSQRIIDLPRVPTMLGDMGIFTESGISTTTFMIERQGSSIKLLPTAPRGGVAEPVTRSNRKVFPLSLFHIPASWSVMADEVQGVRAYGSETELMQLQTIVDEKLGIVRGSMELTHEWQRIGALKGMVLEADGTELLDLYDAFDMVQPTQAWNIASVSSGDPKASCLDLKRAMKFALGGRSFSGVRVMCSNSFFVDLIQNNNMKKAWDRWQEGQFYRDDQTSTDFVFANNVRFTIYDYSVGGTDVIEDGFAYAFPEGVPGLFQSKFAPADYAETVNTVGLPFYAKQEPMRFNKGIDGEAQSNPLHFCSLPETVFKLTAAATF